MTRGMVDSLTISEVSEVNRHVIGNLLQLCLHDYSEFSGPQSRNWEVTSDGLFEYEWFDSYWHEVGRIPLLIRTIDRIVGFALINRWSALEHPLDHALAEFFVLRKHRRSGVGSRALRLILERYPGQWEVPVARNNRGALSFWRRAIPAAGVVSIQERAGDEERWSGTVLCFGFNNDP